MPRTILGSFSTPSLEDDSDNQLNNSLLNGYNRLFINKKKPKLPEADFL